jgi:hypothetical protein
MVLLVLGAVMLAACGGDGGSSDDSTDGGATGTEAGGTTGTDAGGTTGTDGGGDLSGVLGSAECAEVAAAMVAAAQSSGAAMSGSASDLDQSLAQLEAFADAVPDEIRADMETILTAYRAFTQALQDSGYDPSSGQAPSAEQMQALQAAAAQLDTAEVQAASERVNAYVENGCQT